MENQSKPKLFREKSLEAIESPESLNDYLRVTSPGVWLIMATVIVLLTGMILWGIFGRINTTAELAVSVSDGKALCYVPYEYMQGVMETGSVTVNEESYPLRINDELDISIVSEEMNALIRLAGDLEIGDVTVVVPVDGELSDGVYTGSAVTESLQPIALLLQ